MQTNFQYQYVVPDVPNWKLTDNGNFTIISAWEFIRKKKDKNLLNSCIWSKHIPFKVSFLVWRALRKKLPTNDKIISFGAEPVECTYCIRAGLDDIDNIFVIGNFANHIWQYFSNSSGISHTHIPLHSLLISAG